MDSLEHSLETTHPLDKRAEDFARRLRQTVDELHKQGSSRGLERQLKAERKLRQFRATPPEKGGGAVGRFASVVEILELTYERWLARLDTSTDLKGSHHP